MRVKPGGVRTSRGVLPLILLCGVCVNCGRATDDVFYATVDTPGKPQLVTIEVRDTNNVTIAPVGPMDAFGCASIARSAKGVLYSV